MGFNAELPMGNTGISSNYQKVLSVEINDNLKQAEVTAIGYKDKDSRDSGADPLPVTKQAGLSPDEYDAMAALPIPDEAETIRDVFIILGYEVLRMKIPEFEDADTV